MPINYEALSSSNPLALKCTYAVRLNGLAAKDAVSGVAVSSTGTVAIVAGAYGNGLASNGVFGDQVSSNKDPDVIFPATKATIALITQRRGATTGQPAFGYNDGATSRVLCHLPYAPDGNIHWDYGSATTGRLSVSGQTFNTTTADKFLFVAGPTKGREIWRNGTKIGANTGVTGTRPPSDLIFQVIGNLPLTEPETNIHYYLAVFNDELSDAEAASWFSNPDQIFANTDLSITAPFFINSNTFFSATLSQAGPVQTLTAPLHVNPNVFFNAELALGSIELSAPFHVNPNVFFNPTLNQTGSQTIIAPFHVNPNVFFSAELRQTQTLTTPFHVNSNVFFNATLNQSGAAQTLTAPFHVNPNIFFDATLNQAGGLQTLTAPLFINPNVFFGATLAQASNVVITPPFFINQGVFFNPALLGGLQIAELPLPSYTVFSRNALYYHRAPSIRPKTPLEIIAVCFDFTDVLDAIDAIDSVAISVSKGADANVAQMLLYGPTIYQSKSVIQLVRNGVSGVEYLIKALVVNGAEKHELACRLLVKDFL